MMRVGIIGAGPGGYEAAIRAAQLGMEVWLFEERELGGTCLNRGCIPTKALWQAGNVKKTVEDAETFGIGASAPTVDPARLYDRMDEVVTTLRGGIEELLRDRVTVVPARASLNADANIVANGEIYEVDRVLLASGSRPVRLPITGGELAWTSDELLRSREIPESLVVIGGGVIGLEFASIYAALGSEVTVLTDYLLPQADAWMVKRLRPHLKKQGITIEAGYLAESIALAGEEMTVCANHMKKDKTLTVTAKRVLMATGRRPATEGMGLETAGIECTRGIEVDANFKTAQDKVYAVGDCVRGNTMLAHVASSQAIHVVENWAGKAHEKNLTLIPSTVFLYPELAWVGMSEEEVKEKEIPYRSETFPMAANGKALTLGETAGVVKVIAREDDGKLLGVHVFGAHAGDLVASVTPVMARGGSVDDFLTAITAHPSLGEAVSEAMEKICGSAIHAR